MGSKLFDFGAETGMILVGLVILLVGTCALVNCYNSLKQPVTHLIRVNTERADMILLDNSEDKKRQVSLC